MDKKEIDERLNALSERVLSKALTPDEETNYTESLDAGVQSGKIGRASCRERV